MDSNGGLVFISHSHYDIPVVREIRNRFEQLGFEPLVFYLKCLNDSDEIESLIRREIDEREWFVFVDSENSRKSAWVKSECEYITGLSGKKIFTINTAEDIDYQVDCIARQLQIYISFSASDLGLARRLKNRLLLKDYRVCISIDELESGKSFADVACDNIKLAASSGFMLLLVTQNTSLSAVVHREIAMIRKNKGIVIPVYFKDGSLNRKQLKALGEHTPIYVEEFSEQSIDAIVAAIEGRITFADGEKFDMSVFE